MENMAFFAFFEPQDAFGSKHAFGELFVEKILEFTEGKRAITAERQEGVAIDVEVVRLAVIVMAVIVMAVIVMAVSKICCVGNTINFKQANTHT